MDAHDFDTLPESSALAPSDAAFLMESQADINLPSAPVIVLEQEHLPFMEQILDSIGLKLHQVSVNALGLGPVKVMKLAMEFKDVMIENMARINQLIIKITIHVNQKSVKTVQNIVRLVKLSGINVPIDICIQKKIKKRS